MKAITKLGVLFLVVLCFNGRAQQSDTLNTNSTQTIVDPETVVIKTIESNSFGILNNIESKIIVVDNNNQLEIRDLKRVNFNYDGNDGIEFNTRAVRQELQKWHSRGFLLKSSSSAVPKADLLVTIYVLQKG